MRLFGLLLVSVLLPTLATGDVSVRPCVVGSLAASQITFDGATWSSLQGGCGSYETVKHMVANISVTIGGKVYQQQTEVYANPSSIYINTDQPSEILSLWDYDYPLDGLDLNQALVRVVDLTAGAVRPMYLWRRSSDCYRCNNSLFANMTHSADTMLPIDVSYSQELSVSTCDRDLFSCKNFGNFSYHFGERGVYSLVVTGTADDLALTLLEVVSGDTDHGPYCMPILYAFLIYLGLALLFLSARVVYQRTLGGSSNGALLVNQVHEDRRGFAEEVTPLIGNVSAPKKAHTSLHAIADPSRDRERLQSLDSFRGFALCIMIFVNAGGGGYYFFSHTPWNGLTVADLVFPWFIWIMGTSMAIAYNSLFQKRIPRMSLLYKLLRRSAILFLLGMVVVNGMHDVLTFRVPGVLQRFGVSYLGVGLLILFAPRARSLFTSSTEGPAMVRGFSTYNVPVPEFSQRCFLWLSRVQDIAPYIWEWVIVLVLVLIHTVITFNLPISGCPSGYLGPGGRYGEYGAFFNGDCATGNHCCVGGATGLVDRAILTDAHIYDGPTCEDEYGCGHFDPEGTLGALNSIVLCFLGLQSGRIIVHFPSPRQRVKRWLIWGVVLGAIAGGLSGFSRDEGVIPINKNLWSISFTCCMASFGFFVLSIFYLVIDVYRLWDGAPFRYVGLNSILVYLTSEVLANVFPLSWVWNHPYSHGKALFMNLTAVSTLCLMAFYCFVIKFFIKI